MNDYRNLPAKLIQMAADEGGHLADLAARYQAAADDRQDIGTLLMSAATLPMWLHFYHAINGRKGGRACSDAKREAARANGRKGGRPRRRQSESPD